MKCFIIDDEELARELVKVYCEKIPELEIVGEFSDASDAVEALKTQKVDLLLLDIQMPEMTGIEFVNGLNQRPLIIFTTAYKEFALDGFELDVTDYLLKPFSFERFEKAISKAKTLVSYTNEGLKTEIKPEKDYLVVKSEHKVFRIFFNEINYIQSLREYVAFYTNERRTMTLGSLKKLESELPSDKFIRVHKSYIIARHRVNALEGGMLQLGKEEIPIGPSYKERVLKELF